MTGVASFSWRKSRTMASTRASFTPAFRARLPAAWMIGPSAIGSVNGMPISIRSAPAAGMPRNNAIEVAPSGSHASRNGINAPRPSLFSAANRLAMRLMSGILGGGGRKPGQGGAAPPWSASRPKPLARATGPCIPIRFFVEGGGLRRRSSHGVARPPQRKTDSGSRGRRPLAGFQGAEPLGLSYPRPYTDPPSEPHSQVVGDGEDVLIPPPAQVHHDDLVLGKGGRQLRDMRQRMCRLQRRDN